jgi:RNA polymerase-binding protein DksA
VAKGASKGGRKTSKPAVKRTSAAAKPAAKPKTAKAVATPKSSAKVAVRPPTKPAARPASTKPSAKPPTKPSAIAAAKVPTKAPAPAATKPGTKSTPAKAPAPIAAPAAAPAQAPGGADRPKPKGITIVQPKPQKKPKPKKIVEMPSLGAPLLGPGGARKWKPLIPSGPNAKQHDIFAGRGENAPKPKSPFNKRETDRFRDILLRKRAELVGDVSNMEAEALNASSGSLSHLPQHMAEQGSETFEQALNLNIAQVDRNLIKEIDAALKRIDEGTFGMCELTGKPISKDRLEELPWTRHSIEAARELERRTFRPPNAK